MKKTKTGSFWTYFISGGVLASLIFIGSSWIANDSMPLQYVANVDQVIEKKEPEKTFHIKTPETVRGIYMTSWVASTRDWRAGLVKMIEETELNSIVIDVKDYTGKIAFEVSDPEIKKYNSDEKRIDDIKEFINSLHEKNIYVIARIAVFQDP
ncbi:putative glycoside hydrolase, partial [Patescibacteria group bacterium]|nr:putative glycoside hydrolase [Patescibacteria group bacterium]